MTHPWPPTPGWTRKTKPHLDETAGYVLAESGGCLDVQLQETLPRSRGGRVPGRRFVPLSLDQLVRLAPPPSWFLGILLCPGDPTEALVRWARAQPAAYLARIVAYHAPRFDVDAFVDVWTRAGLPPIERYAFRSWAQFHHLYGLHHSIQSFDDHHGPSPVLPCREDHVIP